MSDKTILNHFRYNIIMVVGRAVLLYKLNIVFREIIQLYDVVI